MAKTVKHDHASLEKCLEVIRKMDGFLCSQISIQHMDKMIMIGGGSHQFIVTVETNTAIHNLLSLQEEEEEWGLTMYCWGNSQPLPPTVAAIEFKETC